LRTLEKQIRKNWEGFALTGAALKEIRDDELYDEVGCATWDQYLSQRVDTVFGIARRHAQRLMVCAEIRPKLPAFSRHGCRENGWPMTAMYEFRRLAPQDEEHSQRFDFSRLKKGDVSRVAKAAVAMADEKEVSVSAAIVRKCVDEDIGYQPEKRKNGKTAKLLICIRTCIAFREPWRGTPKHWGKSPQVVGSC